MIPFWIIMRGLGQGYGFLGSPISSRQSSIGRCQASSNLKEMASWAARLTRCFADGFKGGLDQFLLQSFEEGP